MSYAVVVEKDSLCVDRIKKDLLDTKKAEEKARKEAILLQHRQKKAGDGDTRAPDEESSKHPPAALTGVQRRAKAKAKSARPQSQPPVRGGAMHNDSLENLGKFFGFMLHGQSALNKI